MVKLIKQFPRIVRKGVTLAKRGKKEQICEINIKQANYFLKLVQECLGHKFN